MQMSTALPACPSCQSEDIVKNGRTRHDKQNYKCRHCGRQFVENPQWRMISEETKGIIDRLLLEKLSRFRHCSCFADFPSVVTTIRQSEIQAGGSGGTSAPKAETPSD